MDSFNAILSRFLGSALTHVQLSYFVTFKTCPPMRQPPVRRMDDVCVCVFAFEMGRVLGPLMEKYSWRLHVSRKFNKIRSTKRSKLLGKNA